MSWLLMRPCSAHVNLSLFKVNFRTNVNYAERISRPNYNCRSILGVNMKQENTRLWMWYWKRWLNYSSLWITFQINLFLKYHVLLLALFLNHSIFLAPLTWQINLNIWLSPRTWTPVNVLHFQERYIALTLSIKIMLLGVVRRTPELPCCTFCIIWEGVLPNPHWKFGSYLVALTIFCNKLRKCYQEGNWIQKEYLSMWLMVRILNPNCISLIYEGYMNHIILYLTLELFSQMQILVNLF